MVFLDGYYLLSLDGTGYFSSEKVHCRCCMQKTSRNGKVTYYHQMLGAAIVHPELKEVIPLMPEPIIKQDGQTKNDCERNAAVHWLGEQGFVVGQATDKTCIVGRRTAPCFSFPEV